ncbi:hypothetical protein LCGC14_0867420 [marine sediment metagenome]|uniref:PEP-CTERM protein-sorting domain-containing protein n=1 Tax=marine sediment metagenome TaxID=412755 RepID=A0A0F9RQ99_9ZZZZ|nr:hypothetical protein [Methylophaga sp.]
MKSLNLKSAGLITMLFAAPLSATAATINLNSVTGNTQTLALQAGTYSFKVTSGAWNAWSPAGAANCTIAGCTQGWVTQFNYLIEGGVFSKANEIRTIDSTTGIYATAAEATLAAQSVQTIITLTDTTNVSFTILDAPTSDNIGNLEIDISAVSAVPIPAAAFLFAPALLGFMGLRRKSKQA